MSIFSGINNPGIDIEELTSTELATIQEIDGISHAIGTILVSTGTVWTNLGVGTDTHVLTADSGEAKGIKWAVGAGGGDVSKVGTPVDSQIGVWTGDGTIEGDTALTFDTTSDSLVIAASGNLLFGAVTVLDDNAGTMTLSNIDALDATTETTIEAAIDTLNTLTLTGISAEPALSAYLSGITGTDNQVIDISASEALNAAEHWTGIRVKPDGLDPSAADTRIRGMAINLSGVSTANGFESFDGLRIVMPSAYDINTCAIDIQDGKICHNYTTGSAAGAEYGVYGAIIDATSLNAASEVHAFDVEVSGGTPSGEVVALGTHSNVHPVHQHIGTFSTPDQSTPDAYAGRKTGGGASWADGIDGIECFIVNSDEVYIGAAAVFGEIEVIMTTPGTKTVSPTFWFNIAADTWTQFFPVDNSNGFKQDGTIRWTAGDIPTWTNDGDPGAGDTAAGYWIKIIRTAAPDPGTPTPTTLKTGTITEYAWSDAGDLSIRGLLLAGDLGLTGTRVTKGWFTDLECTNAMVGSITGTAAVATTVTVTDNEATNESNVITFVADAAGSGNVGLEADGDLTYNPSTGKVTATGFIGALTGQADTVATITTLAPDTATTQATQGSITTCSALVTVGALASGSIASGFGTISTGNTITTTADLTGLTVNATGDTSAGDNAVMGYTATEGLILTGQGSTNDVTIKNDADAQVLAILTGTTNVTLGVDGTASDIIMTEKSAVRLDPAGGADGDYSGITFVGTAGETVAFGDAVYLKAADSEWYLVDADATATAGVVAIAVCVSSGTDNNPVTLMTHGILRADAGFPALTIGAPVYLSLTGTTTNTLTVTAPSATDDVVKIVGHALTADEMLWNPSVDWITIV